MKALQFSGVGIANKRILLGIYHNSSTLRDYLRSSGQAERYIHGLKVPISIKAKPFPSMCLNESSTRIPDYTDNKVITYTDDQAEELVDAAIKSYSVETQSEKIGANLQVPKEQATGRKAYAKIHDFCFGIPYGGLLFSGGLLSFIFTRTSLSLTTSMLGAAIVALAAISLKVWRRGLSSLPFMLGQAALATVILVKQFRTYSLTKNIFPAGVYIFTSVAMLCFYSYVLLSGGNPPPKRNQAAIPSS